MSECVSVLSAKWMADWAHDTGIGWWVLDPSRVLAADYLLNVSNQTRVDYDLIERGPGPHNHINAVMRGLSIKDKRRSLKSNKMRFLIGVDEVAILPSPIPKPLLIGSNNPVRYVPTGEVPLDFEALPWQSFADLTAPKAPAAALTPAASDLTTFQLVELLAQRLAQTPDALMKKLMVA